MATSSTPSEVRSAVARLIDVCRDAEHGFELAARGVVNEPILRAELLQYAGQRQEFVADLNDALRRAGQAPIQEATPAAVNARPQDIEDDDFQRLEAAVAAHDRVAILSECARAEAAVEEAYRSVTAVDLPAVLSGTVAVQLHAITRVHDRVHSLLEVAESDASGN